MRSTPSFFCCWRVGSSTSGAGQATRHAERSALTIGASVAALVFALHPLRVESVAWATERRDLVSALFAMLAVLAYLRAQTQAASAARLKWIVLAVFLFALGSLSKVIVTLLPLVLIVLDIWPLRRRLTNQTLWIEKLPFLAISLVVGVIGIAAARDVDALQSLQKHGPVERLMQLFHSLTFYVQKTLLPAGLSPLYELPDSIRPADLRFAVSACVAVAISAVLIVLRKRWPAGLAAWACYVILLLPVSGLTQNGPQMTADRYSYLSCMGFAVLIGAGAARLVSWNRRAGSVAISVCGVSAVALGVLTVRQIGHWQDSSALWRRVIAVDPHSAIAHNGLGTALLEDASIADPAERYRLAIPQFRRAIELDPDHPMATFNLGVALHETGQLFDAELRLRHAIAVKPSMGAYTELGRLLVDMQRPREAVSAYEEAIKLADTPSELRFEIVYGYGIALQSSGRPADAIRQYAVAEPMRPQEVRVPVNRCLAHIALGQLDAAASALSRAKRRAPQHPLVLDAEARLRAAVQRGAAPQ